MVKYLSFHNSSFFCLKILFNVNGKAATLWHTPCFLGIIVYVKIFSTAFTNWVAIEILFTFAFTYAITMNDSVSIFGHNNQ